MRIQNEQAGSTSLFAQPMAIEAVPEEPGVLDQWLEVCTDASDTVPKPGPAHLKFPREMLETRLEAALGSLMETSGVPSATVRQAHLALLKRWYYRPEAKRAGEIFFPDAQERWPLKAILRGAGRITAKMLSSGRE
jgi:hypothetical protein